MDSSLAQRKGQSIRRKVPLVQLFYVVLAGFFVVLFLYIKSFNDILHHHKRANRLIDQRMAAIQKQQHASPTGSVVLNTELGAISIKLREDLSKESSDYIRQIIGSGKCPRCSIYRVQDKGGIIQGVMRNPELGNTEINVPLGKCPPDITDEKLKDGSCHGPVMTNGMVGWAGGKSGPDFFIDGYKKPANFWGTQHTVWGELIGEETSKVMKKITELPVENRGGMTYLLKPLKFTMKMA